MNHRRKSKHFPIPKLSPIANEASCIIEEFDESEKEDERPEKYAIEATSSPPQPEGNILIFEPTTSRRKPRRSKRSKVDKRFLELYKDIPEPDSDSPERQHVVKKIFRKSIRTYIEDDSLKAKARQVASIEGCPQLFSPETPGFNFQIETYPSPLSKDKMCRNLYPNDSIVEDMQDFLNSSKTVKKRSKNSTYSPIKCTISKRIENPIGTPPKRLKTSFPSKVEKSIEKHKKSCPALNVEDVDSDLSVVEATPPKIIKKCKKIKVRKTRSPSVKGFQSRSLIYSPELKSGFSSKLSFRLNFSTVAELESSPLKLSQVIQTECVAKKRINFEMEEKENDILRNDDLGFSICSQILSADFEPATPFKEMSQLSIDEYHSPPLSAYYEIENVPSPLTKMKTIHDENQGYQIFQDESDIECDLSYKADQIVQDESDNEDKHVPEIHDDSDIENDQNSIQVDIPAIQDFSSPDYHPFQEIDNTSFSEICYRNTEPEQFEILRTNLKPRKKPKAGSLLEKAYAIKSRMEKDSKFFEYELKNELRPKTGNLVSLPLERISSIVHDSLFFIFCRSSIVEGSFVIVAINISKEALNHRFLFLHYPFTVVFDSKLNLTLLFVRNQIHSENNFEWRRNSLEINRLQRKKPIQTLTSNVTSSVLDLVAAQCFMPEQTLNLMILHVFETEEDFCVVCSDKSDFCVLDFRRGQIKKVKNRKNIRHGISIAVTGFHVIDVSPVDDEFKSLLEFASGKNVENDHFYTLTPLAPAWEVKTAKRTIEKLKKTSSIEAVLKENDPKKRYRVNAVFVTADESGIFISDNFQSQKVKVIHTDAAVDFREKSLGVLDGTLFKNGQFIVDRYTQVIGS